MVAIDLPRKGFGYRTKFEKESIWVFFVIILQADLLATGWKHCIVIRGLNHLYCSCKANFASHLSSALVFQCVINHMTATHGVSVSRLVGCINFTVRQGSLGNEARLMATSHSAVLRSLVHSIDEDQMMPTEKRAMRNRKTLIFTHRTHGNLKNRWVNIHNNPFFFTLEISSVIILTWNSKIWLYIN